MCLQGQGFVTSTDWTDAVGCRPILQIKEENEQAILAFIIWSGYILLQELNKSHITVSMYVAYETFDKRLARFSQVCGKTIFPTIRTDKCVTTQICKTQYCTENKQEVHTNSTFLLVNHISSRAFIIRINK